MIVNRTNPREQQALLGSHQSFTLSRCPAAMTEHRPRKSRKRKHKNAAPSAPSSLFERVVLASRHGGVFQNVMSFLQWPEPPSPHEALSQHQQVEWDYLASGDVCRRMRTLVAADRKHWEEVAEALELDQPVATARKYNTHHAVVGKWFKKKRCSHCGLRCGTSYPHRPPERLCAVCLDLPEFRLLNTGEARGSFRFTNDELRARESRKRGGTTFYRLADLKQAFPRKHTVRSVQVKNPQ